MQRKVIAMHEAEVNFSMPRAVGSQVRYPAMAMAIALENSQPLSWKPENNRPVKGINVHPSTRTASHHARKVLLSSPKSHTDSAAREALARISNLYFKNVFIITSFIPTAMSQAAALTRDNWRMPTETECRPNTRPL